jgi:predicted amino acid-binding ACT domain protein
MLSGQSPSDNLQHEGLMAQRVADAKQAEKTILPADSAAFAADPDKGVDHVELLDKYIFPMRADNTTVFFDQNASDDYTLMFVFAEDHHGLVLDVISVLKALSVKVWRTASSENDALRLMAGRIEGELVSFSDLKLSLDNCCAFWISDEATGEKLEDPDRLEQIQACIQLELSSTPASRPAPSCSSAWHRVTVEQSRHDLYSVFSIQTADRPNLLAKLTSAFASQNLDVCSAAIQTFHERIENTFFVRTQDASPLSFHEIENANEAVMRALLRVGDLSPEETLWFQSRHGSAVFVSEAVFIDDVCNVRASTFAKHETPNYRGRLPDAPYVPVFLQ